ncbi:MAG: SOS response-associated peptidase [Spirochaetota bacterium]|nr:SOS response-associated peptidase [Spirochaetota bacterium]
MCGRFAQICSKAVIEEEFEVEEVTFDLKPSYNVAPGQDVAIIIDDGTRRLHQFQWGLIPFWAKDPSIGRRMINARAETIYTKPSYKYAFRSRRCLVVADGFYEWRRDGKMKVPVFLRQRSERPMGFAGLHETWIPKKGEPINTCTIITTEANELVKQIHNRMPAIINKEDEYIWLNSAIEDKKLLLPMLNTDESHKMEGYEVSTYVNSPKNNSPECIKPI